MALLIIAGIVGVLVIWLIATYNGLIKTRNQVDEAWSDIDVQLKLRYDLIPNLINTVKEYASHEKDVFESVTKARTAAMTAEQSGDPATSAKAENMLSATLKSLFAVSEAYPQLRANENFMQLQQELTDIENKIQAARRFYNGNVRDFNTKVQVFPTMLIANVMGFTAREFFEIEDAQRENPGVDFNKS